MPDDNMLAARGISRYFGRRQVLFDVDLSLRRGEILGFLGPNGAGKSTTMKILCGVLGAHAGSVAICGHDIQRTPTAAKRHLGFLPEVPPLYDEATVDEYLRFAARLRGLTRRDAAQACARVKGECALGDVGDRLIANLSKGYRQRIGIAQATIHQPDVLILDEPTSGLDPNQIREVREMIREIARQHAVVLSTHILPEVQSLCNRVVILHQGRLVFDEALNKDEGLLLVKFQRPPDAAALTAIDGVLGAEPAASEGFSVRVSNLRSTAAALVATAVHHDWGLYEVAQQQSKLEQVFVELTCNDDVRPSAGGGDD